MTPGRIDDAMSRVRVFGTLYTEGLDIHPADPVDFK